MERRTDRAGFGTPVVGSGCRVRGSRCVPRSRLQGPGKRGRCERHVLRSFTIIELVIALMLLSAGVVTMMELFHRAHLAVADAESALTATHLAQRRLEELRNAAYAGLTNEAKASIGSPSGYSRFSRQVTVTMPYTNLKQIVVTVYWSTPLGEVNVSLQTYRSNS